MAKLDIPQVEESSIRKVVATGTTGFFLVNPLLTGVTVQVSPAVGATATVYYTATNPAYWGADGSGAAWEPVATVYQFTELQTIHFRDRIFGVRVASAAEATTVDVLGGLS